MRKETWTKIIVALLFAIAYTIFYELPAFTIYGYELPIRLEAALLALSLLFGWFGVFSISAASLVANIHYGLISGHSYLYPFAPINFIVFAAACGAGYLFLQKVKFRFNDFAACLIITFIAVPVLALYWAVVNKGPFMDYFMFMLTESLISINIIGYAGLRILKSSERFQAVAKIFEKSA